MIVDLERFVHEERPKWERLDTLLRLRAKDPWRPLPLDEARELERLYQRASADLARLATFAAEPEARRYLEGLVARAYAEVHGAEAEVRHFRPWHWFVNTFPRTFRRRFGAFRFAAALLLIGSFFGVFAVALDPDAKSVLMPFSHLEGDPRERVAAEERGDNLDRLGQQRGTFAGYLMVHNTRVTLLSMALGLSAGIGTLMIVFSNGVMLGAVVIDYVVAGESIFLLGWLLPHGVIELPAVLIGSQAGFVLAQAMLGRGERRRLRERLRAAAPDVVTLSLGAGLLLVWAGCVESFLSQYHAPVVPYGAKIAFGCVEAAALWWWLARSGRSEDATAASQP
ncbi:MAG TPA: stage II sporulation protein M [Opitutaceae bacterium]|nr:stage II sporulation protein M [Opitutaceae bacterium]